MYAILIGVQNALAREGKGVVNTVSNVTVRCCIKSQNRQDVAVLFQALVRAALPNTIRHVVIWLDPWSRKRDLLTAVVDR